MIPPKLAATGLGLLLVVQVGVAYLNQVGARQNALHPFLPGHELRGTYRAADGTSLQPDSACWHAYYMSTHCEHCRRLARAAASDSAAGSDHVVWLFQENSDSVTAFVVDTGLENGRAYSLANRASLREVGVFATPSLATFRGTRLIHLTMATRPMSDHLSDSLCAVGEP